MLLAAVLLVSGLGCSEPSPVTDALVVVLPRAPEQIDPRHVGDPAGLRLSRLLFASLVTIDAQTLLPVPDLAERVDVLSPVRYRATLREGLRFSDGAPLDARDVVATFRSIVDPAVRSRYARTYSRIERVFAEDRRTVVFELDAPHATFLTDLEMPVLRRQDARRRLTAAPGLVGAGPYRLAGVSPGRLTFEANPFWHGGVPKFPRVVFVVVREDNTRALQLLAGEGTLSLDAVPPQLVPVFEQDPRFAVRTAPGIGTTYVGIRTDVAPLNDVRVRRALAHAIDRETLIAAKLGGRGQRARGWIPPGHWAFEPNVRMYDYDPARARRLLHEAGHRDGSLHLLLRTNQDRFRVSVARALAAMWRDVGVDVTVRSSDNGTLIEDLNRGHFQLCLLAVPEVIEPHVLSWFFASDRIPSGHVAAGANRWRFRNASLDAAFERGRAHHDRATRVQAYSEVQRILASELPVVPLWHRDVVAVLGPGAGDFVVPRHGRFSTLAR